MSAHLRIRLYIALVLFGVAVVLALTSMVAVTFQQPGDAVTTAGGSLAALVASFVVWMAGGDQ